MAEPTDPRVAVYLDFDNIVMSWYDRVHGRLSYSKDRQKIAEDPTAPGIAEKLEAATVDVGALIDYAASFGSLMLTRAYADWSAPVNAEYRDQLVARAVDLVQLFPAAAYAKNGADIRLAVDAVEDMFRIKDLTHVVIVAGDSDYVPLAQRCKRLGCHVVGVGVAGSTAKSLAAACDEFESYETLPGVELPQRPAKTAGKDSGRGAAKEQGKDGGKDPAKSSGRGGQKSRKGTDAAESTDSDESVKNTSTKGASGNGTDSSDAIDQGEQSTSGSSRRRRSSRRGSDENAETQDTSGADGAGGTKDSADGTDESRGSSPGSGSRRGRSGVSGRAKAGGRGETTTDGTRAEQTADDEDRSEETAEQATGGDEVTFQAPRRTTTVGRASLLSAEEVDEDEAVNTARRLLKRALQLGEGDEWLHSSAVKTYMRRMDPSFSEKALGHKSFSAFLKAHTDLVEMSEDGYERMVRAVEED